jgi:hypothetical protein
MTRLRQVLKWVVPFVVSGGLLYYQFSTIDTSGVLHHVKGLVGLIFVPALLVYGAFSLWIEALSLNRVLRASNHAVELWTAARMKAASYLFYILHYALGAGALTVLLRRRAGVTLSEGGGVILLIALFDMGVLFVLTGVSAAFHGSDEPVVRAGAIAVAGIGLVGGFALLRTPHSLGPLDRLRSLTLFRAARTTKPGTLLELGVLRLFFVVSFLSVGLCALWSFEIHPPLTDAIVNITLLVIIATLPIAVSGLGTTQAAFIVLFREWGDKGILLACSLTLSAGLIALRAGMGFLFSQEFVREAIEATRHGTGEA